MTDGRRMTLVARDPRSQQRDWDFTNSAGSRIVFVDSLAFLPYALDRGVKEAGYDVERVVIDRTATPQQFLELIAALPHEFAGDLLFVGSDGAGFLNAPGRGDGRLLYSMTREDLDFYLQTHSLICRSSDEHITAQHSALA